jgi:hypothetical protein
MRRRTRCSRMTCSHQHDPDCFAGARPHFRVLTARRLSPGGRSANGLVNLFEVQWTPAKNTARPDGYYWANDRAVAYLAAMESALTHARLLNDFFKHATGKLPTAHHKANDRYAAEYCVNGRLEWYRGADRATAHDDRQTAIAFHDTASSTDASPFGPLRSPCS